MNDLLELANQRHKMAQEMSFSSMDRIIKESTDQPEMSPSDMKVCIVRLEMICQRQEAMIQKLVSEALLAKEERQSEIDQFLKNRK